MISKNESILKENMGIFNYTTILLSFYQPFVNRESSMCAHVLLNLSGELGKRDKMLGLLSIASFFGNKFNKFSNTGAGMLNFIYHMPLKLF